MILRRVWIAFAARRTPARAASTSKDVPRAHPSIKPKVPTMRVMIMLCNRRAIHDLLLQVVQLSGTKNTMNVFIKVPPNTLGIKTTTAQPAAIHLAQRLVYELSQTNPLTKAELLTLLNEPCLVLSSSLRSFLYHLDTSQASIVSITISDKVDSLLSQHEPNTYQSRSTLNYSNHTKQHTLIKQLT